MNLLKKESLENLSKNKDIFWILNLISQIEEIEKILDVIDDIDSLDLNLDNFIYICHICGIPIDTFDSNNPPHKFIVCNNCLQKQY